MPQPYHIAVFAADELTLESVLSSIRNACHVATAPASNRDDLADCCGNAKPDLLIVDLEPLASTDLSVLTAFVERADIPIIALCKPTKSSDCERFRSNRIFAYLDKPVRESELLAAINLSVERFRDVRTYRAEVAELKKALEERKVIERAKGIVMQQRSLSENDAFVHVQQLARRNRMKMAEVARSIVLAHDTLLGDQVAAGPAMARRTLPRAQRNLN